MPHCDIVVNNLAKTFNSWVLEARTKPIVELLEDIRKKVMIRMTSKREQIEKWTTSKVCPRIQEKLENAKVRASHCECIHNGKGVYEVIENGTDGYKVNINTKECACRCWDVTGIPCHHAVACIWKRGHEPEDYNSDWFTIDMWRQAYEEVLTPVNGKKLWPKTGCVDVMPPEVK